MPKVYHSIPKEDKVKGYDLTVIRIHIDRIHIRLPGGRIMAMVRRQHPTFTVDPRIVRRQWKWIMGGEHHWAENIHKALTKIIEYEKIKPNSESPALPAFTSTKGRPQKGQGFQAWKA